MNIPGAKLIEQGLAALPSHARLEVENRDLRAENAALKAEISELKAQLAILQPQTGIPIEAAKVLLTVFRANDLVEAESIARSLQEEVQKVIHYLDMLSANDFVQDSTGAGRYELRPKGREFVVKNRLA